MGGHHVFQHQLSLGYALVDALAGGAAHIQPLHPLVRQIADKGAHPLRGDGAGLVIAGVKRGDDALVLGEIFH